MANGTRVRGWQSNCISIVGGVEVMRRGNGLNWKRYTETDTVAAMVNCMASGVVAHVFRLVDGFD